jgi:hypothetical protein
VGAATLRCVSDSGREVWVFGRGAAGIGVRMVGMSMQLMVDQSAVCSEGRWQLGVGWLELLVGPRVRVTQPLGS